MDSSLGILVDLEVLALCQMEEYLRQFVGGIIVEMNGLGETALQSGIRVDEVVHLVGIASHDTDELSSIVFQPLQQSVDGF